LQGEVRILGGNLAQDIDRIYLYVATEYECERDGETYREECRLIKHQVSSKFTIQPREEKIVPFSIQIPHRTPLTLGRQEVYISTGLDIAMAINPRDRDYISIEPHPFMQAFLDALGSLGFQLRESDCQYNPTLGRDYPFVQELEFVTTGKYRSKLDELEVIFYLESDRLEVLLEIDRKARGFSGWVREAFDADESHAYISVSANDLEQPMRLLNKIEDRLREHIR
jgi:sporulation-control protein